VLREFRVSIVVFPPGLFISAISDMPLKNEIKELFDKID
jgi:hypothetical protein